MAETCQGQRLVLLPGLRGGLCHEESLLGDSYNQDCSTLGVHKGAESLVFQDEPLKLADWPSTWDRLMRVANMHTSRIPEKVIGVASFASSRRLLKRFSGFHGKLMQGDLEWACTKTRLRGFAEGSLGMILSTLVYGTHESLLHEHGACNHLSINGL